MLTPTYLQNITDVVEEITASFNSYIIDQIVGHIVDTFRVTGEVELIPTTIYDVRKALGTGMTLEDVARAVAERMPEVDAEVRRAFEDATIAISNENAILTKQVLSDHPEFIPEVDEGLLERSGIPANAAKLNLTPREARLIERAYQATDGEIKNLTRTTAEAWQKEYMDACDEAYWKATHGVSIDQAVKEAIDRAAQKGTRVVYPSGHTDRIEVAVARAVRTGINQAAAEVTLSRCAEMGVGYVLVSAHLGARTTPNIEPANHFSWQGQVYALNWEDPALTKFKPTVEQEKENKARFRWLKRLREKIRKLRQTYPDFVEVTGYGTGEGLCGWNCRHSFSAFYPGINENNQPQFGPEENEEFYEAQQKARAMERAIRKDKIDRNAYAAAADAETDPKRKAMFEKWKLALDDRIRQRTSKYQEFCQEHGLKTQYERMYVARNKGVPNKAQPSYAANSTKRNTFMEVFFDETKEYKIELQGYSANVNAGLSEAAINVAREGSRQRTEHMYLVDLQSGALSYYETNDQYASVGYNFWDYLEEEKNITKRFAFVHNHNTDSSFSETDMLTMLQTEQIPVMIAVRNDGVIYVAERKGKAIKVILLDDLYPEDMNKLNGELKNGKLTPAEHTRMREETLVDNVLRDYTKGGGLQEYESRKKR